MPFSHHSHSGQFCPGHARDTTEEIIKTAISKRMQVFALTEHMPRHNQDLYPEEIESGWDLNRHYANEAAYFKEALRLREKYKNFVEIPIGFECDWIRRESLGLIKESLKKFPFDFFIGSVHHVHTIPIDFSDELYAKARTVAGGSDEKLFMDYFDAQLDMLEALKPSIIGHFDLIRLKSDDPNQNFHEMHGVWQRVLRNLDFVGSYGGILELNFASLRKGMTEPYPQTEICKAFLARGGKFCLSDDCHGVDQVALNYHQVLPFLEKTGINTLHFLSAEGDDMTKHEEERPFFKMEAVAIEELRNHNFYLS